MFCADEGGRKDAVQQILNGSFDSTRSTPSYSCKVEKKEREKVTNGGNSGQMCSSNPESGKKGDEVVDDEESSVSFLENLKKEQQHQMLIIKIAALFHLNSLGDSVPSLC